MDQCVLLWRCVSRPVGGTPALYPSSVALFPPSLLFLSFPSPFSVFLLFSDSITPHSSSLSFFRTNALSHHCFSSLLFLSHTPPLSQVLPPLAPIFHFCWTPIFSLSLPLYSPYLSCSFLLSVCHFSLWIFNRYRALFSPHIHMK